MNKYSHLFISLLFLILIWMPLIVLLLSPKQLVSTYENRNLKELPVFDHKKPDEFVEEFEQFFSDHFGLRNSLIWWNSYLSLMLFNESPIQLVLVGRDGWLFFTKGTRGSWDNPSYKLQNLKRELDSVMERSEYLAKQGIQFINLIVPNKHTIYPEYLPENFPQNHVVSPRFTQRLDFLKKNYAIDEIDLRSIFLAAKKDYLLYYKTDTHWTSYGSFFAYVELMKKVKEQYPQVELLSLADFSIEEYRRETATDLAHILSVPVVFSDQEVVFHMREESKAKVSENKKLNKLIVYHDSFFDPSQHWSTIHFLKHHFKTVQLIKNTEEVNTQYLTKEKPDVVIYEKVERNI